MPIFEFEGRQPKIAESAYISPTAMVIGDVSIGERCYVGHGAILRGDYGTIEIGPETAVEEGVIIHARPMDKTTIGSRVTIGHGAMIHNATIEDEAVIGMRATVSDFSIVGEGSIIGEAGLVRRGQKIPAKKVATGLPVRIAGDVDEKHQDMTRWAKKIYVDLAARYLAGGMCEIPSREMSDERPRAFTSIGMIRTPYRNASGTPIQGAFSPDVEGTVEVDPAYLEGLADLDGFSHVILVYIFDRAASPARLTVSPYLDDHQRGVFATRAPSRPNPIGITVVSVREVTKTGLRVAGVDMLDGTPLLDIKPYVPAFDRFETCRCGWLEKHLEFSEGKNPLQPVADERFYGRRKPESVK